MSSQEDDKRSLARWEREEKLREAEVSYIVDRQRRNPEYWWDRLCSDVITLQLFLHRAKLGKWVIRRNKYWDQVTQEILRTSRYRAVQDRVKELQEIQTVRQDALEAITPRVVDGRKIYPVRPGNLEGMIGALVKLDKLSDDKRDVVLTMIEPELRASSQEDAGLGPFTADEWRDVARMLLESRQARDGELTDGTVAKAKRLKEAEIEDREDDEDDEG